MKSIAKAAIALLTIVNSFASAYETPTDGKFFYSQYYYDQGASFVSLDVGSDRDALKLRFNSEELTLAVFTSNCTEPFAGQACNIANSYNYTKDGYNNRNTSKQIISNEIAFLYQQGGIEKYLL